MMALVTIPFIMSAGSKSGRSLKQIIGKINTIKNKEKFSQMFD